MAKKVFTPEWLREIPMKHLRSKLQLCVSLGHVRPISLQIEELYLASNDRKCFVSLDIKSANFNMIRMIDPSIIFKCDSWPKLVRKCVRNASVYLQHSKKLRQVVLGKVAPVRIRRLERHFLKLVWGVISSRVTGLRGTIFPTLIYFALCSPHFSLC